MNHLEGKYVALTASRKTDDMQTLLRKQGATSEVRSMQGTVKQDQEAVTRLMQEGLAGRVDWFIFTTGIGVTTLMAYADEAGMKERFLEKMQSAHVAARGYKTVAALKKLGINVDIRSDDGTTAGLKEKLKTVNFSGEHVIIQQYGVSSPVLEEYLEEQGATLTTWLPYVHEAPDDAAVDLFIEELLAEKYDAVCFTTGLQVRSLFNRANEVDRHRQLLRVFADKTIATAVGKVTAEALEEESVSRVVVPTTERMGAMMVELGRYVSGEEVN
ncbi:uroporphyrinogen-III synthase [Natribacillus halophilus]|uniref:Uroporphyrinogen-III synthase n=1 Tax=Natribacillus halophilus TaxID=549003 RepID=A0A1G8MXP5_9BACI|nr:uroporphyrinogen-III synthase [Natribacillus halophilus]SDI72742.1 uroporphyrinogen-III synthase [Natribacillus halophilus]